MLAQVDALAVVAEPALILNQAASQRTVYQVKFGHQVCAIYYVLVHLIVVGPRHLAKAEGARRRLQATYFIQVQN